jgi:hypothetical protein
VPIIRTKTKQRLERPLLVGSGESVVGSEKTKSSGDFMSKFDFENLEAYKKALDFKMLSGLIKACNKEERR